MLPALRFLAVSAVTALLAVVAIAVALFDRGGRRSSAIVVLWARTVLRLAGAEVAVEGAGGIPTGEPLLFVASHRSLLDVPALYAAVPPATRFLAKRELFRIPLFGQAIGLLGFVPIDRGDRLRARRALERAAASVGPRRPLLVFPEGTRNPGPGLLPFKKGAFALAVERGLTVVPIACLGSDRCLPARSLRLRPGRVRLLVGPSFRPGEAGCETRHALADSVREAMLELLDRPEQSLRAAERSTG